MNEIIDKEPQDEFDGGDTIELRPEDVIEEGSPAVQPGNDLKKRTFLGDLPTEPTAEYPPTADSPEEDKDTEEQAEPVVEAAGEGNLEETGSKSEDAEEAPAAGPYGWRRGYLAAVGVIALAGFMAWLAPEPGWLSRGPSEEAQTDYEGGVKAAATRLEAVAVRLYMPDKTLTFLQPVNMQLNLPESSEGKITVLLEELFRLNGVKNIVFPDSMETRGIYIYKSAAIVSLNSDFRRVFHTGAWTEYLATQAIAHTVAANIKGITQIKLLIDDAEAEQFAGHINITGSLYPDKALLIKPDQPGKTGLKPPAKGKNG